MLVFPELDVPLMTMIVPLRKQKRERCRSRSRCVSGYFSLLFFAAGAFLVVLFLEAVLL